MSTSFSTGKVSWKRTELNLWIKTLIRWNKNCTPSGSPVCSEILQPRWTKKNDTVETLTQLPLAETQAADSSAYFWHFLSAACSATAPAAWLTAVKYESASVVQTVTSQVSGLPPRLGTMVQPSGRFPSLWARAAGSFFTGMSAALKARLTHSFTKWLLLFNNKKTMSLLIARNNSWYCSHDQLWLFLLFTFRTLFKL